MLSINEVLNARLVESITFDEYQVIIHLSGEYCLQCECLLRFLGDDGTFITSEDHCQMFGLEEPFDAKAQFGKQLIAQTILDTSVSNVSGDLILKFDGGRLELICSSSGYENWQLHGPDCLLVGQGGRIHNV
jgi:hypothetical protein